MKEPTLDSDGFCVVPAVLKAEVCHSVAGQIPATDAGRGGTRCLLSRPWCVDLARALKSHAGLAPMLADAPVAVQCTYFEKSAGQNWLVALHQDLSIPVAERVSGAGCKAGPRRRANSSFSRRPRCSSASSPCACTWTSAPPPMAR